MVIGIDASNIRAGGGITHLAELLNAATPQRDKFREVNIWAGSKTLRSMPNKPWLRKHFVPSLDKSLLRRVFWQRFRLSREAEREKCNVLFIPGGTYSGSFRPFVTMSQNLLPFEWKEMRRYGVSWQLIRNGLLRFLQSQTFRRAEGVIFLTRYAQQCVTAVTGPLKGKTAIIPHGINLKFNRQPKRQLPLSSYSTGKPLKILYVSTIDVYKHQPEVCIAVSKLIDEGYPLRLDLVGSAYPPALSALQKLITLLNIKKLYPLHYEGPQPYEKLPERYAKADIFIFASSCENMPIILMEAMVAGLPIASSNLGPMPEVLKQNGKYFDPERPDSIADSLRELLQSAPLRSKIAKSARKECLSYSWTVCAEQTFQFINEISKAR